MTNRGAYYFIVDNKEQTIQYVHRIFYPLDKSSCRSKLKQLIDLDISFGSGSIPNAENKEHYYSHWDKKHNVIFLDDWDNFLEVVKEFGIKESDIFNMNSN